MAGALDRLGDSMMQKWMDFLRHIFQFAGECVHEYNRKADLNLRLETFYKFQERLENFYDFEKHEQKNPGEKMPFDISACKAFASRDIQKAFENAGIHYIMYNTPDRTYIVTESDDKTRAAVNKIKMEAFKDKAMSPRLTKADLYNDNAGRDIISFAGIQKMQLEEFTDYAQKKGFFFAATQNEYGTYSIHVAKDIAEMPAFDIQGKINHMSSFMTHGVFAEFQNIVAKQKSEVINEAIAVQRSLDPTVAAEKTYIIDATNPGHYIEMNGKTLTIVKDNKTQRFMDDDKHEQRIFNEINTMGDAKKVSEADFRNMYRQNITEPGGRMAFAQDYSKMTQRNINAHLMDTVVSCAKANGLECDKRSLILNRLKEIAPQFNLSAKQLETNPPSIEAINKMLETGDALKSGLTSDIITAKQWNNAFDKAVHLVVTECTRAENRVRRTMEELAAQGKIDCGNLTPEEKMAIINTVEFDSDLGKAVAGTYVENVQQGYNKHVLYEIHRADSLDEKMDEIIENAVGDSGRDDIFNGDHDDIGGNPI